MRKGLVEWKNFIPDDRPSRRFLTAFGQNHGWSSESIVLPRQVGHRIGQFRDGTSRAFAGGAGS